MSRLVVDNQNQLKELKAPEEKQFSSVLTIGAKSISFIFHPVFIPVFMTWFLIRRHPYAFAGFNEWQRLANLLQVFVNCTFLPLVAILLLWRLKFVDSILLKTQKDRIIPYVICMIFYFWNWYVFKNNFASDEMVILALSIFISSILGFLMNISFKISMHTIAAGILASYFIWLALTDSSSFTLYMVIALVISGLAGTARLIVSDHSQQEIYWGFITGVFSTILAVWFV